MGTMREAERWCEELLGMRGCENDAEGLIGRAEALIKKEEYEQAKRVLEKAFEETGRRRDVRTFSWSFRLWHPVLMFVFFFR